MNTTHSEAQNHGKEGPAGRRHFLVEFAALVIGGLITLIPAGLGAAFVVSPLRKSRRKTPESEAVSDDGFRKVGTTAALISASEPTQFPVIGTRVDAWTTYPQTTLGKVYVRQQSDGQLECFNVKCPHLGCDVRFVPSDNCYLCPCHASAFSAEGAPLNDIPPRGLDTLDAQVRNGDEIWVRFQNFEGGREEKIPV